MVRVYLDGVFDLGPHIAHVNFMKEVRKVAAEETKQSVTLIVGVIGDADTESYKRRPIVEEQHRSQLVSELRCVDHVVPNAPLVITAAFLNEHKIDLVFHGDDMSGQGNFFEVPIRLGIMRTCPYDIQNTGISTTELIRRVQARIQARE